MIISSDLLATDQKQKEQSERHEAQHKHRRQPKREIHGDAPSLRMHDVRPIQKSITVGIKMLLNQEGTALKYR
jgi:hypothetical protein